MLILKEFNHWNSKKRVAINPELVTSIEEILDVNPPMVEISTAHGEIVCVQGTYEGIYQALSGYSSISQFLTEALTEG